MENFLVEAEVLLSEGGAIQVEDASQLAAALRRLLADAPLRKQMGEKARALVESRRDMAERYRLAISRYCDLASS
jgi:3-deoxy-D-manno-octulosonic-acid transferase